MARSLRPMALILLSLLCGRAGSAPVHPAELDAAPQTADPVDAAALGAPPPATAAADDALLPARPRTDGAAEPMTLATDLLEDVEAAGSPTGGAAKAKAAPAAARPQAPRPASAPEDGIDPEWREFGKSAWQWVKDRADWVGDDGSDAAPPTPSMSRIEWADTGPGGIGAAGFGGALSGGSVYTGNPVYSSAAPLPANRGPGLGPEGNLVREALNAIREIVEHPMTWLVIALVAIGAFAVKKLDRRPK